MKTLRFRSTGSTGMKYLLRSDKHHTYTMIHTYVQYDRQSCLRGYKMENRYQELHTNLQNPQSALPFPLLFTIVRELVCATKSFLNIPVLYNVNTCVCMLQCNKTRLKTCQEYSLTYIPGEGWGLQGPATLTGCFNAR